MNGGYNEKLQKVFIELMEEEIRNQHKFITTYCNPITLLENGVKGIHFGDNEWYFPIQDSTIAMDEPIFSKFMSEAETKSGLKFEQYCIKKFCEKQISNNGMDI